MNTTATEAMVKHNEAMEERYAEKRFNAFYEKWTPEDPRQAAEFHAEFSMLIRSIYMDMQKPVTETVSAVLSMQPRRPLIFDDEGQKRNKTT